MKIIKYKTIFFFSKMWSILLFPYSRILSSLLCIFTWLLICISHSISSHTYMDYDALFSSCSVFPILTYLWICIRTINKIKEHICLYETFLVPYQFISFGFSFIGVTVCCLSSVFLSLSFFYVVCVIVDIKFIHYLDFVFFFVRERAISLVLFSFSIFWLICFLSSSSSSSFA